MARVGQPGRTPTRITSRFLAQLKPQLTERDLAIAETVGRFKLATATQLQRLFFVQYEQDGVTLMYSEKSRARNRQAVLKRLTEHRVLARIGERGRGGPIGGSASYVYALDIAGQALTSFSERPRRPYVPYDPSIEHYLAITDLYVQLVEADRANEVTLLAFDTEPYCHRTFGHRTLKPDAFVQLGLEHAGQRRKRSYFIEVDRGTQYGAKISTKIPQFLAYHNWPDRDGIFPLVVLLTRTERRASYLRGVVAGFNNQQKLFCVDQLEAPVAKWIS